MTPQPDMPFFSNQGGSAALACNGYVQTPHRRWPRRDVTAWNWSPRARPPKASIRWSRSLLDGRKVGQVQLTAGSWRSYFLNLELAGGRSRVAAGVRERRQPGGEDRNLKLDKVTFFREHMRRSRRRIVWWNVHSNPELSLISAKQAAALENGGLIALLNGCTVGGFRQPGTPSHVDVQTAAEHNLLVSLIYGQSAFLAAWVRRTIGSTTNTARRCSSTCTRATAILARPICCGSSNRTGIRPELGTLRGRQEMLLGDPFLDACQLASERQGIAAGIAANPEPVAHAFRSLISRTQVSGKAVPPVSRPIRNRWLSPFRSRISRTQVSGKA